MAAMPAVWSLMRPSSSMIEMPLPANQSVLQIAKLQGVCRSYKWIMNPWLIKRLGSHALYAQPGLPRAVRHQLQHDLHEPDKYQMHHTQSEASPSSLQSIMMKILQATPQLLANPGLA